MTLLSNWILERVGQKVDSNEKKIKKKRIDWNNLVELWNSTCNVFFLKIHFHRDHYSLNESVCATEIWLNESNNIHHVVYVQKY